jgi:hypothetical protein
MLRRLDRAGPAITGLLLAAAALGPALGSGFVLSYDMVFVPAPPIGYPDLGPGYGPPRAVPSDLVVALASRIIPASYVQKVILIAIFVLACSGAAALLAAGWSGAGHGRPAPLLARLAAGVCFAWNPFVAERLIMGQWALLLGYAGLPWLVREAARRDSGRPARMALALVPAAIGGFAAVSISALAAIPVACLASVRPDSAAGRLPRALRAGLVVVLLAAASLPWAIPALSTGVRASPVGAAAFAARADTPFGTIGSLLMLGGIWNSQAVPAGYGGPDSGFWLAVAVLAIAGYILAARPGRICSGLGVAACCGLALAAAGTFGPGLGMLRAAIGLWPGFAVLRDGQQFIAPLALAEAIGLGAGVAALLGRAAGPAKATPTAPAGGTTGTTAAARAGGAAGPAVALGVLAVLAPPLLLPGLAWGAAGHLRAVRYPADWLRARRVIEAGHPRGAALLLPWAQYRRFGWNHGEPVYDPWPRLLGIPMIWNDALTVGSITVPPEGLLAVRLSPVIASGRPLTGPLLADGVRYVIIDSGPLLSRAPARLTRRSAARLARLARLPGARVLLASADIIVFRLTDSKRGPHRASGASGYAAPQPPPAAAATAGAEPHIRLFPASVAFSVLP